MEQRETWRRVIEFVTFHCPRARRGFVTKWGEKQPCPPTVLPGQVQRAGRGCGAPASGGGFLSPGSQLDSCVTESGSKEMAHSNVGAEECVIKGLLGQG